MKKLKLLSLILAVLMRLPLALAGCRGDSPTIPNDSSDASSESESEDNGSPFETTVIDYSENADFRECFEKTCMILNELFWNTYTYKAYLDTQSKHENWGNYCINSDEKQFTYGNYPAGPKINVYEVPNVSIDEFELYTITLETGIESYFYTHLNIDRITLLFVHQDGLDDIQRDLVKLTVSHYPDEIGSYNYLEETPDAHLIDKDLNLYFSCGPNNVYTYTVPLSNKYAVCIQLFEGIRPVLKEYFMKTDIIETLIPLLEKLMYEDMK